MAQSKSSYERPDYQQFRRFDNFSIDPKEIAHKHESFNVSADDVPTGHEAL